MILKFYVIGGWQKCNKFELMNDIHISITSNNTSNNFYI